ncbi:MAG TPA: COX15/CtaA family protein [Miltoncostaeales bacterium]|jgi:cytochrome c oxidase assembly protein subunit 15|nr:COX15/CtaA family protein [Miltoncostaeales bacterium]
MNERTDTSAGTRRGISLNAMMWWTMASAVGLTAIIPSGGLVRLTKSGLGCPDWPGCHGEVIPTMTGHAAIEYSNRVLSFLIIVIVALTWFLSRRAINAPKGLSKWTGASAIASVAQGPLGGLTVLLDLHPLMVGSHFLLSIVALAPAVVAVILVRDRLNGAERPADRVRSRLGGALWIMLCAVISTGVVVTAAGPHSGDEDVTRRFWNLSTAAMIHVRMVIAFVIMGVAVWVWHHRSGVVDQRFNRLVATFVPLLITQVILGEYQYRNGMRWGVIFFHVTTAGLLFVVATAAAWRFAHPPLAAQTAPSDSQSPNPALQASSTAEA